MNRVTTTDDVGDKIRADPESLSSRQADAIVLALGPTWTVEVNKGCDKSISLIIEHVSGGPTFVVDRNMKGMHVSSVDDDVLTSFPDVLDDTASVVSRLSDLVAARQRA